MNRKFVRSAEAGVFALVAVVVAASYLSWRRPGRPTLVVWSCGGNYESLVHFGREFETRYGCDISYTAAPVQYLLELATRRDVDTDILVGRGGPGWQVLRKQGKLLEGPTYFAIDPYVIAVRPGNPARIRGLEDLQRPGLRVACAPAAMSPKGKVISHLVYTADQEEFAGLYEGWRSNASFTPKCGRELAVAVASGRADAAVTARSTLTLPGAKGRVESVPIAPPYMRAMKSGRGAPPQCMAVLKGGRNPELARSFREEMLADLGRQVFEEHGYFHITSPKARPYRVLMRPFTPPGQTPWQVALADRLLQDGITHEAARRYLKVIHTFGPSEYDAYCRYQVGVCAEREGRPWVAAAQWRRALWQFPRRGPHEWAGIKARAGRGAAGNAVTRSEEGWVRQARISLERVAGARPPVTRAAWARGFYVRSVHVAEGEEKAGTRDFALAEDLFAIKDYEGAARDYLKVLTLHYPSRHMSEASFRLGLCNFLQGRPVEAAGRWGETIERFPDSPGARLAARARARARARVTGAPAAVPLRAPGSGPAMPAWQPRYGTWPERGMSYGMALHENGLPVSAFKEMMKLIHHVYGPSKLKAEARYRSGVCALDAGHVRAAVLQWRLCGRDFPRSPWAGRSRAAIKTLRGARGLSEAQRRQADAAAAGPLPPKLGPPKPSCRQRLNVAEELFHAGILERGQAVMEYLKVLTATRGGGKYDESVVPQAEYRIGACLGKTGQPGRAVSHYRTVVTEHPGTEWAERAAAALKGL